MTGGVVDVLLHLRALRVIGHVGTKSSATLAKVFTNVWSMVVATVVAPWSVICGAIGLIFSLR